MSLSSVVSFFNYLIVTWSLYHFNAVNKLPEFVRNFSVFVLTCSFFQGLL